MNTKGMKFLAVLAVLAMAFAAFSVVAPAEIDDATAVTITQTIDGDTSIAMTAGNNYVVIDDATVTVTTGAESDGTVTFYVLPETELELKTTAAITNSASVALVSLKEIPSSWDTENMTTGSIVTVVDPTSFDLVYVASTYTGLINDKNATISGTVTTGSDITADYTDVASVKGMLTVVDATKGLDARYTAGTAYKYSKAVYTTNTKDVRSSITYYGADVSTAVTIDDEASTFIVYKGSATVTVKYKNVFGSGGDWNDVYQYNGSQTTVLTIAGVTANDVTISTYKQPDVGEAAPNIAAANSPGAASELTVDGRVGVNGTYSIAKTNAFSSTDTIANGTLLASTAKLTTNMNAAPTVGSDGFLNKAVYAFGTVKDDIKMDSAVTTAGLELIANAVYTGTVSAYSGTTQISKMEFTDAKFNDEVIFNWTDEGILTFATTAATVFTSGEMDIVEGTVTLDLFNTTGFTLGKEATLYVKAGSKLAFADQLANSTEVASAFAFVVNGTMKVAGELSESTNTGYISVTKDQSSAAKTAGTDYVGKFKAKAGAVFTSIIVQGGASTDTTGTIDLDDAMSVESVSGDTIYAREYSQLQTVKVTGPYTVKNGVTLTIRGTFEVPAGVTVGIENGAKIVVTGDTSKVDIAGTLSVAEGTHFIADSSVAVNVSGNIYSEGAVYIDSVAAKIADGGKFVSEGQLYIAGNGMAVATGGTLDIRSNFNIAKLQNSGTVILNDAVLTRYAYDAGTFTLSAATDAAAAASSEILMYEKGAEVKIVSLGWNDNVLAGTTTFMKIKDAGLKTSSGYDQVKDNYVTIECVNKTYGISGLTITEKVSSVANTNGVGGKTSGQMILSGSVDYINSTEPENAIVKVILGATSASTASDKKSDIVIDDSLRIGEYVEVETVDADITVKGTFTLVKNSKLTPTSGKITVTGKLLVLGSNALPTGLGTILNGAVYKVVGDEYTYMVVTNFTDAVKDNADNTELTNVTVYGSVSTTDDLSIPELVKIKAGANAPTLTVGSGTVNTNTVLLKNGSEIASGIAIIVKATLTAENYKNLKATEITADVKIVNGDSVTYTNILTAIGSASYGDVITASGDVVISSDTTIPEGVTVIIGDDASLKINKNVTLTVAGILASEKDIAAGTGAVFGDNTKIVVPGVMMVAKPKTLDAYKISGAYYSDDDYNYVSPVEMAVLVADDITIKGKVTTTLLDVEGTSTAKKKITVADDASFEAGIIALEYATVAVTAGTFTGTIMDQYATVIFENVTGLTAASSDAYYLSGTATVTDDEGSVAVALGTVTVNNALNLAANDLEFEIASGAQVKAAKSTGILTLGDGVVIEGTITTTNGGSVVDAGKIYILGSLVVMPADVSAGTTAGTASLKYVFVGIDPESLQKSTSAGAVISGASIGSPDYVAVAAGSTVDEQIVADKKFTVFTVDGAAYMTVYAIENAPAIKSFALPVIANAVATEWGNPLTEKAVTTEKVGSLAVVYAMIDYSIYKIEVYTDAGIKAVSIDGVEMLNEKNNMFITISNLKAGTHTIAFTLKDGYQEDDNGVHLYTADGTVLKDLKFTVSGDAGTTKLLLNGTEVYVPEPTPEEQQSEWTITTILLVILVILIAIMAVIVAIRLNRS